LTPLVKNGGPVLGDSAGGVEVSSSTVNPESIKIAESISRVRELATDRENAVKKVTLD
jgi:hypothetical protein